MLNNAGKNILEESVVFFLSRCLIDHVGSSLIKNLVVELLAFLSNARLGGVTGVGLPVSFQEEMLLLPLKTLDTVKMQFL